jgi:hypothetical protein
MSVADDGDRHVVPAEILTRAMKALHAKNRQEEKSVEKKMGIMAKKCSPQLQD